MYLRKSLTHTLQVILPDLGESDVLVRVMACALSRIDVKVRSYCYFIANE